MRKRIEIFILILMMMFVNVSGVFALENGETDDYSEMENQKLEVAENSQLIFQAVQNGEVISEVKAGEEFTVEVKFDQGVNCFDLNIQYDPGLFEYVENSEKVGFTDNLVSNTGVKGYYYANYSYVNQHNSMKAQNGKVVSLDFRAKEKTAIGQTGDFTLNFKTPFSVLNEDYSNVDVSYETINHLENGVKINVLPGDTDLDGKILIDDARLAKRYAMKDPTVDYYEASITAGDLNHDGNITINEARQIKRMIESDFGK